MTNDNQPSTNQEDVKPMYDDQMIIGLFNNFLESGGLPKVTAFKKHLDELINVKVKPLCSGRGKGPGHLSNADDNWRSQQKANFAGRGAKWIKIPLDQVEPTLKKFEKDGIDCSEYRAWTTQAGYAWVRYSGPRSMDNVAMAAFEVRTRGSKEDHPKQLHLRYNLDLMAGIERLENTPHAMGLEILKADPVVSDEEEDTSNLAELDEGCEVLEFSGYELNPLDDGGSAWAEDADDDYEDAMGDIEELMAMEDEDL